MCEHLSLPTSWPKVYERLTRALQAAGLVTHMTFSLQSARSSLPDPESCPCSHHGTSSCTCQYIVLLASRPGEPSVTVTLHGYDQQTELALIVTDGADPELFAEVRAALASLMFASPIQGRRKGA